MQRRKGLGRSGGLERRELKADVEKVREFMRRGRGGLSRKSKPRREPEGPLTPAEWRLAAFVASGGRCMITGAKAANVEDRHFHAHHVLPKRVLRARGLLDRVWDPRNAVWLRSDVHMPGFAREPELPQERIPPYVWEFARELDSLEGTLWATELIKRLYPKPSD